MARAHVREPIYMKDPSTGNLKLGVGASVQVCQPGTTTPFVGNVWNASAGGANVGSTLPALGSDGVAQFWLDTQQDVDLLITLSGFTTLQYTTSALDTVDFTSPTVADGSVTTAKLADQSVTTSKLAADSVTATQIPNGTITTALLAPGAATGAALGTDIVLKATINLANGVAGTDTTNRVPEPQIYGSGLRRSFRYFGGKSQADGGATLVSQTAAWNAARVWSDGIKGGIVEFGAGVWDHMPAIELGMYMGIQGAGMFATEILLDSTVLSHFVFNHVATTASITGNTTSGSAVITNISSMTGLAIGQAFQGTGIPANSLITVLGVNQVTLSANCTATNIGTAITVYLTPNAVGCFIKDMWISMNSSPGWSTNPYDAIHFAEVGNGVDGGPLTLTQIGQAETFFYLDNLMIDHSPQDGVSAGFNNGCRGAQKWRNVHVNHAGRRGFMPPTDSQVSNCESGYSFGAGMYVDTGPVIITACKMWACGNGTAGANGQGFVITSQGQVTLANCETQDCFGAGYDVQSAGTLLVGCSADSNSLGSAGTYPAFKFTSAGGSFSGISGAAGATAIGCRAFDRRGGAFMTQSHAVSVSNSPNLHLDIQHYAYGTAAAAGTPFGALDTSVGIDCNINGLKGLQSVAYAATVTPDFFSGGTVEIGALTAAITIAAPTNGPYPVGTRAEFILKQDATGTRTITWNAAYVNTPTTNTAANAYTTKVFRYDGTSWVGI